MRVRSQKRGGRREMRAKKESIGVVSRTAKFQGSVEAKDKKIFRHGKVEIEKE